MPPTDAGLLSLLNHSFQAQRTQLSTIRDYRDMSPGRGPQEGP